MTDHEKVQELIRQKDHAPLTFEPQKSALVVVDVQRYFARPEHAFAQVIGKMVPGLTDGYFERVKSYVLGNIKRLQEAFREHNLPVIFLGAGCHMADGRDLPEWMSGFDQMGRMLLDKPGVPRVGDDSWQIDDEVTPLPGEVVLNKASSGALSTTKLDQMLHNAGINSLVVCGLTTAVCVTQTARETADRGFRVIVAADACTEMSEEMHEAALFTFGYVFGRVKSTEEIIRLLGDATNKA
jgi:nicotinamidase-related amidase